MMTAKQAYRLHSESTNRENIDINILSRKQSSNGGGILKNSLPSTRNRAQNSTLNYLNCDDILNFAKPNYGRAGQSTKSARFATEDFKVSAKEEKLIKTLKIG
jgi:hypothetical protein